MDVRKRVTATATSTPNAVEPHSSFGNGAGKSAAVGSADATDNFSPSGKRRRPSPPEFHLFSRDPTRSGLLYVILLIFYISMILFVYIRDSRLPSPLPASVPAHSFSEGRARPHLTALLSSGIRNTGSPANEVFAARYIVQQLLAVRDGALPGYVVEIDVQRPSGSFDLNFLGGFTSSYSNVTNILARIYYKAQDDPSEIDRTAVSFLVSAHFDSAMASPAASDDAANIASMLEIARNLVHSLPLPHAVIFNFNGAEESILQAAHGFITQHTWTPSIAAFLNAEGAGGSGRELVFQLGPSHAWLAFAYARAAPYPFASSVAQDIFQSGIIPSDTDFRVYRDYGGLSGVDIAYITDGFVYHTPLDDDAHVLPGSMQRAGENMLATIQAIVSSPQLVFAHPSYRHYCVEADKRPRESIKKLIASHRIEFFNINNRRHKAHHKQLSSSSSGNQSAVDEYSTDSPAFAVGSIQSVQDHLDDYVCDETDLTSHAVFFDCVGSLMVIYSSRTATIVNMLGIAVTLTYLISQHRPGKRYTWWRTIKSLGLLLLGLLASILSAVLVAGVLIALDRTMRWYARPWMSAVLYAIPSLVTLISIERRGTKLLFGQVSELKDKASKVSPWICEEQCFLSTLVLYVALLIVLTAAKVSSAFVFMLLCLLPIGGRLLGKALDRLHLVPLPPRPARSWTFLVCYCISICPPTILIGYACYVVVYFFLPVMGRAGNVVPSELIIAVLMAVTSFVCATVGLSLAHLDRRWKLTSRALITVWSLCIVAVMLLPAYSPEHPKRVVLQHTRRTWYTPHVQSSATQYPLTLTSQSATDSGAWLNGLDWQTLRPLSSLQMNATLSFGWKVDELAAPEPIACKGVYCELPYFYPFRLLVQGGVYLPAPTLSRQQYATSLTIDRVELLPSTLPTDRHRRIYHLSSHGAHHQVLTINNVQQMDASAEVVAWSFHHAGSAHQMYEGQRGGSRNRTKRAEKEHADISLGPFYDAESRKDKLAREDFFVFYSSGADHLQSPAAASYAQHPAATNFTQPALPAPFDTEMPQLATLPVYRSWSFWLEVRDNPAVVEAERAAGVVDADAAVHPLDMGISNHWLDDQTPLMQAVRADLPRWCTLVDTVATWDGYTLR